MVRNQNEITRGYLWGIPLFVVSGIIIHFGFVLPTSREKAGMERRHHYLRPPFQREVRTAQEKSESKGKE